MKNKLQEKQEQQAVNTKLSALLSERRRPPSNKKPEEKQLRHVFQFMFSARSVQHLKTLYSLN